MKQRLILSIFAVGLVMAGASELRLAQEMRALKAEVASLRSALRSQSAATVRSRTGPPAVLPDEPLSLEGSQTKGNRTARAAFVVYSDFQCPYCASFARTTWPMIETEYVRTGQLLVAFRHFPLGNHGFAQGAAEAAECAAQQRSFWPMHDRLFVDQSRLDSSSVRLSAAALGLDPQRFDSCMKGEATERVKADLEGGRAIAVTGTPTFFLGVLQSDGRLDVKLRFSGTKTFDQFKTAIDSLLASSGQ